MDCDLLTGGRRLLGFSSAGARPLLRGTSETRGVGQVLRSVEVRDTADCRTNVVSYGGRIESLCVERAAGSSCWSASETHLRRVRRCKSVYPRAHQRYRVYRVRLCRRGRYRSTMPPILNGCSLPAWAVPLWRHQGSLGLFVHRKEACPSSITG